MNAAARTLEVDATRLPRWVERFAARHGPISLVPPETAPGAPPVGLVLGAADGATATLVHPWGQAGADDADAADPGDPGAAVAAFAARVTAPRRVAVLLVRRGGYACAVVDDGRVVTSKVGSRYVQGRTAAGGWSQQRFARRRAKQTDELIAAAAEVAARLLLDPPASWLATGGDRTLAERVLADRRLKSIAQLPRDTHLVVPDPGARVVADLPELLSRVTVKLVEPSQPPSYPGT